MYKNKIKEWRLGKYMKGNLAQQILEGDIPSYKGIRAAGSPEEVRRRAERSLKRKNARQRARTLNQPPQLVTESSSSPTSPWSPQETSTALVTWSASPERVLSPAISTIHLTTGVTEQFLQNLRVWTHEAYSRGHWDTSIQLPGQHNNGRGAARLLSSYLTSGITLFESGKHKLAFGHWDQAFAGFQSPHLFKSWYHDIPMRLLFEVGRVAHMGHQPLAALLLKSIKRWAHNFLDADDCRHALFSAFGDLEVPQLKDLYDRAARCMFQGLETRIERDNQLLYEVRLNRALDMLWYNPEADLSEWLPQVAEVDRVCGATNYYSVYFLLLEAYRLVARESYTEADEVCSQVRERLTELEKTHGSIDPWRVGLGYRRLGRQQFLKGRFADARRSFNTAYRYVKSNPKLSTSVMIEICQRQISMANDQEDKVLWQDILSRLEQQTKPQEEDEIPQWPSEYSTNGTLQVGRQRGLSPARSQRRGSHKMIAIIMIEDDTSDEIMTCYML
ncbi:hypothetical protein LTR10_018854 [Elasticomyces elasticus]|uniref:Clr5 domain-containing protein n=1 Tax=Exophiala sideris TaxID=1016849 RepID=A0ABR0IW13_9EURO|nr:hypothetical protein LTR10_018854 [Elasticomyces elasticus]KAK5021653.1 hypothetical protein LTS07_010824 [Exophiala sideris]KAK5049791.1 hypothetical protein LTR69_010848 [Exophiala sideris]KAK5176772.1 hypothetical protein LTR44_010715 [Eurotiomycetes sp. CCFEE 6388]